MASLRLVVIKLCLIVYLKPFPFFWKAPPGLPRLRICPIDNGPINIVEPYLINQTVYFRLLVNVTIFLKFSFTIQNKQVLVSND